MYVYIILPRTILQSYGIYLPIFYRIVCLHVMGYRFYLLFIGFPVLYYRSCVIWFSYWSSDEGSTLGGNNKLTLHLLSNSLFMY